MHRVGVYVISLIAVSLICGVLQSIMPAGSRKQILRILCGVFLLLTLLTPLSDIRMPDLTDYLSSFRAEGEAAAVMGQEMALTERQELIKLGLEAYILEKAEALGVTPKIIVAVDPEGRPTAIIVEGSFTREQECALGTVITNDLGIAEEDQQWRIVTEPLT